MSEEEQGRGQPRPRPAFLLMRWIVAATVSAFIALTVAALTIRFDWLQFLEPSSLKEQVEELRTALAGENRFMPVVRKASLHGSGVRSYIVISRHDSHIERWWNPADAPDEVRIYDIVDEELSLEFAFRPTLLVADRGPIKRLVFQLISVTDMNEDGVKEIFGAFYTFFMDAVHPRPIVIGWDPAIGDYRIAALLGNPPLDASQGVYARAARRFYQPAPLLDASRNLRVTSYATEGFIFPRPESPSRLVTAYIVKAPSHDVTPVMQVVSWSATLHWPTPEISGHTLGRDFFQHGYSPQGVSRDPKSFLKESIPP
jgi:hypothetical protein